jgi:hypothetical protein
MDPLWYNVYSIGNAQFDFAITIAVYKPEDSAPFVPDPSCESTTPVPGVRVRANFVCVCVCVCVCVHVRVNV